MSEKQHYSVCSSVSDSYSERNSLSNSDFEYECSFSTLKHITGKTYLRSTMSEQRLDDLTVLSIERYISSQLSLEQVVDKFADQDKIEGSCFRDLCILGFKTAAKLRLASQSSSAQTTTGAFTDAENEVLEMYFDSFLEAGDVPSSEECREFLESQPIASRPTSD